ncbi:MAG: hypothetical protein QXU98_07955 [Candidatus Parvarchaeota archaeon]
MENENERVSTASLARKLIKKKDISVVQIKTSVHASPIVTLMKKEGKYVIYE